MSPCPSCGFDAPAGSRFCPSCGTALADAPAAEETLRLVTVLFADVVGSTARAESLHPEDLRALMSDFFAAMAAEIEAEGGTIEKFVGDAIMAVFGVPAAHEDDPVRAVRAARRMLARLGTWNAGRSPAERLELRIGLNTGEVVAAGEPRGELLVTGDAVNVAARLQQVAEPGTIVVGGRTARAARSHYRLQALDGPLPLKGKSKPVAAWLVDGEREAAEPRGVPGVAAPLVGREGELASLGATFDRVRGEGRPELVTLLADAGIGKSRLVREFLLGVGAEARALVGRCQPAGHGATLRPLAEMLESEAGVLETDGAAEAAAKIARLVEGSVDSDLAPEPARTAAALAATLGLRLDGDPLASLDPRQLHRELVAAWLALLASLARRGPLVAVVEDLHWADATMLDVLDELAERLQGPVLFVCTARPDLLRSRPEWGGGRRAFSALPLDPLNVEESERLVSLLLDVDALSAGARQRILQRSEGNPFFLEEIVRHLIDEQLLLPADGRWRAAAALDEVEIPDSVQGVILARLDLLAPEERRVAQRAAVVGRAFWPGAVAGVATVDDLDAALRTLRRREFVVERLSSSVAGEREFAFKHVLTRDVAYESLPRRERGRAHAAVAAWLEATVGERAGELAVALAHHYDSAFRYLGDDAHRRRARESLLAAAADAHRRFAIEQGERHARRAVELSAGDEERAAALEALGDLHYLAFHGDAAWRTYVEALEHLPAGELAFARVAGKAGLFGARWLGTMEALPPAEEVGRVIDAGLRAAPQDGPERTLLLVDRGFLLAQRREGSAEEAAAAVHAAEAAAERLVDPDLLSAALDLVQSWHADAGRYGHADRANRRRLELVPHMRDVKEIGDTLATSANAAQSVGRFREAEELATACVERSRGADPGSYLHGLVWRVTARFMLGEWDGALADQAEIERVAAEDPRQLPAAYTLRAYSCSALLHELRGERDEGDRYVELVQTYFERRAVPLRGWTHSPRLALALARRGRFEEALALVPLLPHSASAGGALEALCELAAARGRWEEAPGLVVAARVEAEVGELAALPAHADRLEGRAAAVQGETTRAAELLRRSADTFATLGARWEEAWSRLLLGEALAAVDGERAARELAAALPVFERLRSAAEAERTRALLERVAG